MWKKTAAVLSVATLAGTSAAALPDAQAKGVDTSTQIAACNPCNPCNPCEPCNPCNPCNPCEPE